MPTVLRLDGFRVVIYPNDHRPAHLHVIGGGCEAVFDLNCPDGPPALRENWRFQARDLDRIEQGLSDNLAAACREWKAIHGQP
jgi:hypothetical protein